MAAVREAILLFAFILAAGVTGTPTPTSPAAWTTPNYTPTSSIFRPWTTPGYGGWNETDDLSLTATLYRSHYYPDVGANVTLYCTAYGGFYHYIRFGTVAVADITWTQDGVPLEDSGNSTWISVTSDTSGYVNFTCTVTDFFGDSATASASVRFVAPHEYELVAHAYSYEREPEVNSTVRLFCSMYKVLNSNINYRHVHVVDFMWTQDGVPLERTNGSSIYVTSDTPGNVTFTCEATDDEGNTANGTTTVTFVAPIVCGGQLSGLTGSFRSHSTSGYYRHRTNCTWVITTDPGKLLRITFPIFHVEYEPSCYWDFLQINDGPSAFSPRIARICGTRLPSDYNIISSNNQLFFWFKTDYSGSGAGFQINWTSIDPGQVVGVILWGPSDIQVNSSVTLACLPYTAAGFGRNTSIANITWEQDGMLLGVTENPTINVTLDTPGDVNFTCTLTDNNGDTATATRTFEVRNDCRTYLSGSAGSFRSHSGNGTYSPNTNCTWVVTTDPGKVLRVTFPSFDLQYRYRCYDDFLQVHNGPSASSYRIGKYCGSYVPSFIVSGSNQLFFWFKTDSSINRYGFEAEWTSHDPAHIVSASLYVANSAQDYEANSTLLLSCRAYNVRNYRVYGFANVTWFRDGEQIGVTEDYQFSTTSATPGDVNFTCTVTDVYGSSATAMRTLTFVEPTVCGGQLSGLTGSFRSHSTSGYYRHRTNCTWVITTDPGKLLRITFPIFHVEYHSSCYRDFLQINDGPSAFSPRIARICGTGLPSDYNIISSNNQLFFWFKTDYTGSGAGFQINWTSIDPGQLVGVILWGPSDIQVNSSVTLACLPYTAAGFGRNTSIANITWEQDGMLLGVTENPTINVTLDTPGDVNFTCTLTDNNGNTATANRTFEVRNDCRTYLSGPAGSFRSHSGNGTYSPNTNCTWVVTTDPGKVLRVTFPSFDLQYRYRCYDDFLQVHNGPSASSYRIGKYCGSYVPSFIVSGSNQLFFWFKTDSSINRYGFEAEWTSHDPAHIVSASLYVTNSAQDYEANSTLLLSCRAYNVRNYRVYGIANVTWFRDGEQIGVTEDYQFSTTSATPGDVNFTCTVTDVYGSSATAMRTLTFVEPTVCGGQLSGLTGSFRSHSTSGYYRHRTNCTWVITTDPGKILRITFPIFHLEYQSSCYYDFLQINDGPSAWSPRIGRYCGSGTPNNGRIASTGNQMFFWFKTDHSGTGDGFQIDWTSHDPDQLEGVVLWGPGDYQVNSSIMLACLPYTAAGLGLNISIANITWEQDGVLLEVTENPTINVTFDKPGDVNFTCTLTDKNGDTATATSTFEVRNDCRTYLYGLTGSFQSHSGNGSYSSLTNCTWVVTTDPGKVLRVTFPRFDIQYHYWCNYDFLQVHNGPSASSYRIGKYCGSYGPSVIVSSSNQLFFWFKTDSAYNHDGFEAEWTSHDLDHVARASVYLSGSPINLEANSPVSLVCRAYNVRNWSVYNTIANFTWLRDGEEIGVTESYSYTTTSYTPGYVNFTCIVTDDYGSSAAASTTVRFIEQNVCGGSYFGQSGSFRSHSRIGSYSHGASCTWNITTDPDRIIRLYFESFRIQYSYRCTDDFLEIHDGPSADSPVIGKYCGSYAPNGGVISSTTNQLYLWFSSDYSYAYEGFEIDWRTISLDNVQEVSLYSSQSEAEVNSSVTLNCQAYNRNNSIIPVANVSWTQNGVSLGVTEDPSVNVTSDTIGYVIFGCTATDSDGNTATGMTTVTFLPRLEACGGNLTGLTGSFRSHSSNGTYGHGANCTWIVTTGPDMILRITFPVFHLEYSYGCSSDFLQINNGPSAFSPRIGRFCGGYAPYGGGMLSAGNQLFFWFKSDFSRAYDGFEVEWTSLNLRHVHQAYLSSSTNRPEVDSSVTLHCRAYNLRFNSVSVANFTWTRDDILLGVTEDNRINTTSDTPGRVNFTCTATDDDGNTATAMRIVSFKPRPGDCKSQLSGQSGTFQSHTYDGPYVHNTNCTWVVTTDPGKVLRITFPSFHLENHARCSFDSLQIYDGPTAWSPRIGKYCGTGAPNGGEIVSTGNQLYFWFKSDHSVAYDGFEVQWTSQDPDHEITATLTAASEEAEVNSSVALTCQASSTYHWVSVSVANVTWTQNGESIGATEDTTIGVTSDAPGDVNFTCTVTDDYGNTATAMTTVTFIPPFVCGGSLSGLTGSFRSHAGSGSYNHHTDCTWVVTTDSDKVLRVTFPTFNIEYHTSCNYDYLQINNGPSASSPRIGKYCGSSRPNGGTILSAGNQLYFRFKTDYSVASSGFQVQWTSQAAAQPGVTDAPETGCGGSLSGLTGSFRSHAGSGSYSHRADCRWVVTTDADKILRVTFPVFHLEYHRWCNYDFLQINDGPSSSSRRIGKYCGTGAPNGGEIVSTGNQLYFWFKSDYSVAHDGFQVQWTSLDSGCGGALSGPTGSFRSHLSGSTYGHLTNCTWVITAEPDKVLRLTFSEFHLEYHSSCSYDFLQINDGPTASSPRIGKYCGESAPNGGTITSTGNQLFVWFKSDYSVAYDGFEIDWTSQDPAA